ncbi:MAG: hypothetical protein RMA76_31220 [Deltaproteobacteria bacterium]
MRGDLNYYLIIRNLVLGLALFLGVPLILNLGGLFVWTVFFGNPPSFFSGLTFAVAGLSYIVAFGGFSFAWVLNEDQQRRDFRINELESKIVLLESALEKIERASEASSSGSRIVPL